MSINRGNHENIEMNRRSFENGGGFFSEVKGKYDAALFMMFSQVCILVCLFFSPLALRGAAADRNTGGEQKDEGGGKKKASYEYVLFRSTSRRCLYIALKALSRDSYGLLRLS